MNNNYTASDLNVRNANPQDNFYVYVVFFVVGIVLVVLGFSSKSQYEYEDSLRSVKNVPAKIIQISKYDVTYISTNMSVQPTTVYDVNPNVIKSRGDVFSFRRGHNSTVSNITVNSQVDVIGEVQKKPSEIEVEFEHNGVTRKGFIKKMYFTRDFDDKDVSKMIDIEFNPDDISIIAMSVEGLTWSQFFYVWTLIVFGAIMAIFCLTMAIRILSQPQTPKK
jgi:hypothetical protein